MIDRIEDLLTIKSPFPEVMPEDDSRRIGYYRCDNDGYCWSSTFWPENTENRPKELIQEFLDVREAMFRTFKTLGALTRYCEQESKQIAPRVYDEFESFLNLKYGCYKIKFITRRGDYNLYIYCYDKSPAPGKEGS